VLLVRGDLCDYPNAIVYAVKAVRTSDGQRIFSDEERHPLHGKIESDGVLRFRSCLTEVWGMTEGWFFVLQEQPSEPRFGLMWPDQSADRWPME
jgi:hypothetical protein